MGVTTRFAILVDRFNYSLEQIGQLTPAQVNNILFHKRKAETGEIDLTAPPPIATIGTPDLTISKRRQEYNNAFVSLASARNNSHLTPEQFASLLSGLQKRYPDVMEEIAKEPKKEVVKEKVEKTLEEKIAALSQAVKLGVLSQKQMDDCIAEALKG
jgi:hypothetical protein